MLAFEDIHWADDGMLDAIEHLVRWVRAPLLVICLARDDLLERRPGWGGGRVGATQLLLEPLTTEGSRELVMALLGGEGGTWNELAPLLAERSGGNPLFAEEMVRRLEDEGPGVSPSCRTPCRRSSRPGSTRSSRSSAGSSSRPRSPAGRSGRVCSTPIAEEEGRPLAPALSALQEKDILAPGAESRLAGERELAFKHVLIRDVAYGMLPKAARWRRHVEVGRFIEERAGDRTDQVVALLAEHYGRAAVLSTEAGAGPGGGVRGHRARRAASSRTRATRRPACTRTARRSRTTPRRWGWSGTTIPRRPRGSVRSTATWRCGWDGWTRPWGRGRHVSITTVRRTTRAGWPTCTARSAPRWP